MKNKEDFTNPFRQGDLLYSNRPPIDVSIELSNKVNSNFYIQYPRIAHYKVEKVGSDWVTLVVLDHYEIPIRSIRRKVDINDSGTSLWIAVRIEGSGTGTLWAYPLKKEPITKDEVPTIIKLKSDSRREYIVGKW